jgi:hypothetical protein
MHSRFTTYYSCGLNPLQAVTKPLQNNITGGGQFHAGVLKKPTDLTDLTNQAFEGYQESGIHEGLIYGGIFIENSAGGCISR